MSRCCLKVLFLLVLMMASLNGFGQGPKPYGPAIGVDSAKKIVALAEARKNNWFMAIAVVDPSGTLVYYEKMDNTQTGSADVAIAKARHAYTWACPTIRVISESKCCGQEVSEKYFQAARRIRLLCSRKEPDRP
jgi:glc operon protein GlcG